MISYILVNLGRYDITRNVIILISSALVVFLLAFRLIFALIYILKYYLTRNCDTFNDDWANDNRKHGHKVFDALKAIEEKIKEV